VKKWNYITQKEIISEICELYKTYSRNESIDKCNKNTKGIDEKDIVIDSISDIEYARKIQKILSPLDFVRESAIKQWITKSKTIHIHGIFYRGDLVGVMVYREKPSYLQIRYISIDKGFRGKGLGTYFLLFLEDKCKELQKKKIYAEVPKTHKIC